MKRKVWDITVKDNPNRVVMGENDEFYTTDTEAFLIFNLQDEDFHPQSAMITLENRNDGSLKSEEVEVIDGDIQWEMPERYIEHSGNWQAQLVYEQMKGGVPEKYTSGVMAFTVNSHIKDKKKPSLVEIENWEKFIREGTELIETWEDMEALREENERQRQANYQELLDTGVLQTNINTKLEQLEEEYAPKLTEVTTQLAEKANEDKVASDLNKKRDKSTPIGLNDAGSDLISAIEGGEGSSFNLLSIPRNHSVTPNKTTFINVISKNLFNRDTAKIGYRVNGANGEDVTDPNYVVSDYIQVKPNQAYIKIGGYTYAFYDDLGNFIEGGSAREITAPANADSLRATFSLSSFYGDTSRIYEGTVLFPWEPYEEKIVKELIPKQDITLSDIPDIPNDKIEEKAISYNKTDFLEAGDNKFNKDTVIEGYFIDFDGTLLASPNFNASGWIPVDANKTYYKKFNRTFAIYDKNKFFLESGQGTEINTGTDGAFVRISANKTETETESLTEFETQEIIPYELFLKYVNLPEGGYREDMLKDNEYHKVVDTSTYEVYEPNSSDHQIVAIYKNIAVKMTNYRSTILISTNGVNGDYDKSFTLNKTNLPTYKPGWLEKVMILPWSRNKEKLNNSFAESFRIVLITNQGQIFHNFPSRSLTDDGVVVDGDLLRFEESVVWDLPERKFPTDSETPDIDEMYYPGLPSESYTRDVPIEQSDYGNGGFPKFLEKNGKVYPRFYTPIKKPQTTSLYYLSGFDYNDKVAVIGTYKVETGEGNGTRFCVFVTDDAGRQWYCKYEFSYTNKTNWGNDINLSGVTSDYVNGSLSLRERVAIIPSETNKEPINKFSFSTSKTVTVINKTDSTFTTSVPHNLTNYSTVVFNKETESSPDFEWLANNSITENTIGNGKMFRVKVLTATTFQLKEHVHSWSNPLPCLHIHAVTRYKDGFLIGTGEHYPDSWLINMPFKSIDMFGFFDASKDLDFIRLNSSENAIKRTLGAIMLDDPDNTIIYGSDDGSGYRGLMEYPDGRTIETSRTSSGLFKGRLADIDDASKFISVLEFFEPIYFFKEINGVYVVLGQRGEFAISFDRGENWSKKRLNVSSKAGLTGFNNDFIGIDGVIVALRE